MFGSESLCAVELTLSTFASCAIPGATCLKTAKRRGNLFFISVKRELGKRMGIRQGKFGIKHIHSIILGCSL
jgi:hypothetical protein